MSDGRKRLSGAAYRKLAKQKADKKLQIKKQIPEISSFFKKHCDGNAVSTTELNLEDQQPMTCSNDIEPGSSSVSSPVKPEEEPECFTKREKEEAENASTDFMSTSEIVDDPALWEINDATREYIIKNGIQQDIYNLDLSKSKRLDGDRNRYLSHSLFKTKLVNGQEVNRSYLMYSKSSGKLFCVPCQLFGKTNTKLGKDGFDDWKHGAESVTKHENSAEHKSCVLTLKTRASPHEKVHAQLVHQIEAETKYWRNVLQRVVATIQALCAAGLPLRGRNEYFGSDKGSGNFIMCLELIAKFDPFLEGHIKQHGNPGKGFTSYLSSTTYEQFVKLMAERVTSDIVKQIQDAKYFSIIVDSSPDISHIDELAIIIRYVQENGIVAERFLCFLPSVGHKAEDMFNAVTKTLSNFHIDINNCRGQSYDNASNMSGAYAGLQARILEEAPTAVYTPCAAHSLNLVGEHAAGCCSESSNFFGLIQNLYVFFSSSTKRWEILQNYLIERENLTLKSLSKTRWSARDDACKSLNKDWDQIVKALEFIQNDDTQKPVTRNEACGYLKQLQRLETAILSLVWGQLLDRLNISSKALQSKEMNLSTVSHIYGSLYEYVSHIRTQFDAFEEKGIEKSKISNYEDSLRRKKIRKPQNDEKKEECGTSLTGRDSFKINTFLVIVDRLLSELSKRKTVYEETSSLFDIFISGVDCDERIIAENAKKLCSKLSNDLPDQESLANEIHHFFGYLKSLCLEEDRPKTFFDLYQIIHDHGIRDIYPYVDICIKIVLTMAVSNCSAERSFSVMKRLKNYLRSTTSNDRLNWQAVLTIESDITKALDFNDIIDVFAKSQSRRKLL